MYLCTNVWGPESRSSLGATHLALEIWYLTRTEGSQIRLICLARELHDLCHLCLPGTGITDIYHYIWLFMWVPRLELTSLWLYNKHFTNWAPSPALFSSVQWHSALPCACNFVHFLLQAKLLFLHHIAHMPLQGILHFFQVFALMLTKYVKKGEIIHPSSLMALYFVCGMQDDSCHKIAYVLCVLAGW